jgi:hypothetical protein
MMEYKVISTKVTNILRPDLAKAAANMTRDVTEQLSSGWEPQGGITSIALGTSVYLLQAMVKRR